MSTTTIDAADEASGGEAIFSSDGLPPLPTARVPVVATSTTESSDNNNNDVLESNAINPIEAFEVFSGKLYAPKPSTGKQQQQQSNVVLDDGSSSLLQKLARLKREVNDVENEIQMLSSDKEEGGSDSAAGGGNSVKNDLLTLSSELSTKINRLSSTSTKSQNEQLTIKLHEKMKQLKEDKGEEKKTTGSSTDPNIVYELYDTPSTTDKPTSSLEERILKLEKVLGSSSSNKNNATTSSTEASETFVNDTLLERLDELEKMITRIDSKQLDVASTKAKVIRSDLEAASKARAKLNASSSTSSSSLDNKKISTLYDQLIQLEGIQDHLPALVYRLQQLSTLHKQSASFSTRLDESETIVTNSNRTLVGLEETLSKLESSMISNMNIIEQNMKQIDK